MSHGSLTSRGAKACPTGQVCCGGICADLQADPGHCGTCGRSCSAGSACCAGICIDTQSSSQHCSAYGNSCPSYLVCRGGRCVCSSGQPACVGTCCQLGYSCASRVCTCASQVTCGRSVSLCCASGQTCCTALTGGPDSGCADLQTSSTNCRRCLNICQDGIACVNGQCACPAGTVHCPGIRLGYAGVCANLQIDPNHCSTCDTSCPAGSTCSGRVGRLAGALGALSGFLMWLLQELAVPAFQQPGHNVIMLGRGCFYVSLQPPKNGGVYRSV
jgi:hypothetical protein